MCTFPVTGSMVSVDSKRKLIERTGNGDKQGYCCSGQKGTEVDRRGAFCGMKRGQSLVVSFSGTGKELSMVLSSLLKMFCF